MPGTAVLQMPTEFDTVQEVWQDICEQLQAAAVPLQQVDSYAIELAARCVFAMRQAQARTEDEDPKLALKAINTVALLSRDLMRYLQAICATPGARIRTVKPTPPKVRNPALDALADLGT